MSADSAALSLSLPRRVPTAIGILIAAMAAAVLFMAVTVAEGGGIVFLILLGLTLALVGAAAFTAQHRVTINAKSATVVNTYGALNVRVSKRYNASDFRSVGIMMAARSAAAGGAETVYYVQLVGATNLKLPGGTTDLEAALFRAREVARYLSLPLDASPKMGFFGKRL